MTMAPGAARSRRRLALGVAAVCVASALLGAAAGRSLRSPADEAARRRPPTATPVRVPVERRVLDDVVSGRGDVTFSDAVPIEVHDLDAVVTEAPPAAGSHLPEGSVALEVAERPIVLLQGVVPMYRDLQVGMTGADVRQLEEALHRLGFDPGTVDEAFDARSQAAADRLFSELGYAPPAVPPDRASALSVARAALQQAEATVAGAAAERADAERAVAEADGARAAAAARAEAVRAGADAAVGAAEVALRRASFDAATAHERLDRARAGVDPDSGRPATADDLSRLQQAADAADDAAEMATGAVRAARADREAAIAEQAAALDAAAGAAAGARARLAAIGGVDADGAVASAREAFQAAERAALGAVARDEVVFAPEVPAELTVVNVQLGSRVTSGPLAEVSGARLVVEVPLAAADLAAIRPGASAEVDARDPVASTRGEVTEVDDGTGGGAPHVEVALTDPGAAVLRGRNVRVRVSVASTGAPALVVPVAALTGRSSGAVEVEVERDHEVRRVEVLPGVSADGYVAVEPRDPAALRAGDLVTVGVTAGGAR